MKLSDIIKNVGTSIIKNVIPGGGLIIDVVNEFLPKNKKLPSDATGSDVENAIQALPAKDRAKIIDREFDVDIIEIKESHDTLRTMLNNELHLKHNTRPKGFLRIVNVLCFVYILLITTWSYSVVMEKERMVEVIMVGWPFVAALISFLIPIISGYFGVLRKEQGNRLNAIVGKPSSPDSLTKIVNKILS